MKRRFRTTLFALTGALALFAFPALRAMDDWERRVKIAPDTLIRGVSIPTAFKGLDGKTQPPGVYDVQVAQGPQGILIGLLKNGKRVGQATGRITGIAVDPPEPERKAGGDPPGGSTKGHDISVRKMGDGSVKPGAAQMQDIHFDASSKVSMGHGSGGGEGKISCSSNLHPGGANRGSISFLLPAVNVQGK